MFGEAAVILNVESFRIIGVHGDLVDALAELRIGIRQECRRDSLVGGVKGLSTILAQVVASCRDAQVHPVRPSGEWCAGRDRRRRAASEGRAGGC